MGYRGDDETLAQEIAWYDNLDAPSQRQQDQHAHLEEVQDNRERAGVQSQIESARARRDFTTADQLHNMLSGLETAAATRAAARQPRTSNNPRDAARDAAAEDLAESRRDAVPIASRNGQVTPGASAPTPIHRALQPIIDKRLAQPPASPAASAGEAEAERSLHSPPTPNGSPTPLQEALEIVASADSIVGVPAPAVAASVAPVSAVPEPDAPAPAPAEASTPPTPAAATNSTETHASVKHKRKKPAPAPVVTPNGESIVEYGDEPPAKPPRKPRSTTSASADTPAKPRATRKRAAAKADPVTVDTGSPA